MKNVSFIIIKTSEVVSLIMKNTKLESFNFESMTYKNILLAFYILVWAHTIYKKN